MRVTGDCVGRFLDARAAQWLRQNFSLAMTLDQFHGGGPAVVHTPKGPACARSRADNGRPCR